MEQLALIRGIERIIVVACIPFLLVIGYKLFVMGATGTMQLSTKLQSATAKLTNVSPGALCFVLAVVLGAYSMYSSYSGKVTESATKETPTNSSPPTNKESPTPDTPPISRPTIGTKLQGNTTRTAEWHYLGGDDQFQHPPLSHELRVALNDLYFCEAGHPGDSGSEGCRAAYDKRFKKMPVPADLATIEETEKALVSGAAEDRVAANKKYEILVRAFER